MSEAPCSGPERLRFPEAEERHEWLPYLLEAYYATDQGVHEAIRREQRQGRTLACGKGCGNCCETHTTIPVYPLELIGLYWYATEQLGGETRERLRDSLRTFEKGAPCPFLLDGGCAVHPMRPMACRHFNVFGQSCAKGEDAYHTRRKDVLTPIRRYQDEAFFHLLPFHGVKSKAERRRAIKKGTVHALAKVLQELDWDRLADRMDAFDRG
ncbi:YkgJ family cysteine cluster protein [Thiohalomonas denitrificans]|uniref:Putative zinc-or iron-chelating domain-containing protein n=1 Tax=Thiohalomonas denitrificans TaxID=415747 RepID=A0A1G5QKC3_9GAMM|nr:YkgJ family cysteine cluster protein [Thiohalomonas denitrificans]SCZ62056.1 Putative zinc-or iron-chelating domain-containing protein [Thiohalomonas denitrificans]